MILSAERMKAFEVCPRRSVWTEKYEGLRVSLTRALYAALDAGLLSDKDPEKSAESKFIELASSPGLDIEGDNIYAAAMHHAKLAGIIAAALRSTGDAPWTKIPAADKWESACYDMGDGKPRRIALVDRWSQNRREEEVYGWRTMGEVCALDQPVFVTAVTIGPVKDKRRYSAWTRCFLHPTNCVHRFQKKGGEQFSSDWLAQWREDAGISTSDWFSRMQEDGCMTDLVHTIMVPVPTRKDAYLKEMERLTVEMQPRVEKPPMRLEGCFGFNRCPFIPVCHGTLPHLPFRHGFKRRKTKNGVQ